MANKKNNTSQKAVKTYVDLLYMTPSELHAKDIAAFFQNTIGLTVQLWEEMNVLELELSSENSIDFEPLPVNFKDPSDAAFVKNRGIKTIFTINLCEADLNNVIPYFEQLTDSFSGFICADTVDFTPVYAGSSKKA
ncbi:MAG TPA: hypothetical protein VN258_03215 [Mobilitalea sp.]|nr:hypothetical protein [Mobilitalea sp.]